MIEAVIEKMLPHEALRNGGGVTGTDERRVPGTWGLKKRLGLLIDKGKTV